MYRVSADTLIEELLPDLALEKDLLVENEYGEILGVVTGRGVLAALASAGDNQIAATGG